MQLGLLVESRVSIAPGCSCLGPGQVITRVEIHWLHGGYARNCVDEKSRVLRER